MQTIYFDESFAKDIHDEIIRISGGKEGVHNLGLVSSVLELIQHHLYYPSFEEKLTHLVYSINKNHAFVDGNKRSSIALGTYFLRINGYEYCEKKFIYEMENILQSMQNEFLHYLI